MAPGISSTTCPNVAVIPQTNISSRLKREWYLPFKSYKIGNCQHSHLFAAKVFYDMKCLGKLMKSFQFHFPSLCHLSQLHVNHSNLDFISISLLAWCCISLLLGAMF